MIQRSATADLLKGIAVVLMIQIHIVQLFATQEIFTSEAGKWLLFLGGPLCAPVFMIIFGYYMASSKKNKKQRIKHGCILFLAGMLLNLVLNFNLLLHISLGKINLPIWPYIFGVDILQFAGISMILFALLKKIFKKSVFIILGFSFMAAYLGHYLLNVLSQENPLQYVASYFYGASTWSYFPVFPWIAYAFLGFAFYQLRQKYDIQKVLQPSLKIIFGIFFIIFLVFTWQYAVNAASNLQDYYHHGLRFYFWTLIFLIYYSILINQIASIVGRTVFFTYLQWLGKNVTVVYIIQWILIGNTATIIYRSINSPLVLILSFFCVLATTSILTYGYLKIKTP